LVSIEVRETIGGSEGAVVGVCELFQPLLDVISRAEREGILHRRVMETRMAKIFEFKVENFPILIEKTYT
jgi:hypothetical protein